MTRAAIFPKGSFPHQVALLTPRPKIAEATAAVDLTVR
jgi:hypothetical protein